MSINMGVMVPYTLGPDIYVGWVAGSLSLISAGLLIFDSCRAQEDDDELDDTIDKVSSLHPLAYRCTQAVLEAKS